MGQDFQLDQLVQLGAMVPSPDQVAEPQAAKLMFLTHILLKILGFRTKGTRYFFKNIGKSPKRPSIAEGDKFFGRGLL
jgi:hypothetical protein